MKKTIHILIYCLFLLAYAQAIPQTITFQGRLTESNVPVTATRNMRFAIVDSTGTTTYWQSNASNTIPISVNQGIYTINLGDTSISNMAALTPAILDIVNQTYLRVWVAGTLLTPDIPLNAVPYAYLATKATSANYSTTANYAVTANQLNNGIFVSSNGNVGIGTYTPQEALHVVGKLRVDTVSILESTANIAQQAAAGNNMIFNTSGAPSLTLGLGTWLIFGSCYMTTTGSTPDGIALALYNSSDGIFAKSGAGCTGYGSQVVPANMSTVGFLTVTSGTKTVYLYGMRNGSSTLVMGSAGNLPCSSALRAIRLF